MIKVVVASTNPVKINVVKQGFEKIFPDEKIDIQGVSVDSGVNDQPLTDNETLLGAMNRVDNALEKMPEADFWVGIEGGIEEKGGEMENFAWIVIKDKKGRIGKARSASFFLPEKVAALVRKGHELGNAIDTVFALQNAGQHTGSVGALTNRKIDRTDYYTKPVMLALIPFINEKLYS